MKRAALLASTLIAATPVFAADLCTVQLQKLDDASKTHTNMIGPGSSQAKQIAEFRKNAMEAHKAGDDKTCIAQANQALTLLRQPGGEGR